MGRNTNIVKDLGVDSIGGLGLWIWTNELGRQHRELHILGLLAMRRSWNSSLLSMYQSKSCMKKYS